MGGKTKQNQRTKNNAQPSNSGRSAELLGSAIPPFVGFSAHSDLGMIPFAPGFGTTAENLPETFDSSISGQFQLVLRKMSKKDPVTKVKALQEFTELLTKAEVDVVKGILPLWPKFYHNLANDVDHRVREGSQNVQDLIVTKCKKAVAPYLKQLTPVWLASQFDNYAPAASVAAASFQSVFAANKMQEVCLFCQQEIVDYAVRNITFHTASTLTSAKSCTPEEAEHKYQRVIACSLKMLSFFLEKTAENDISTSLEKIHGLLTHQKFWSFSKHRATRIKSAWFELLYNVLQYTPEITVDIKGQLIPLCFQNIDDSDPLIVPHVWGCILLLQNIYEDWHTLINFKKHVQSKLSTCLRNACNCNAEAVCPNLLPFLSKLTQDSVQEVSLDEFHKEFFKDMKEAITSSKEISRSDCLALTSAHYECIRYILQRHNANLTEESQIPTYILHEMINDSITWACSNKSHASKYIFLHTSALVAYWETNAESKLYAELLKGFWTTIEENIEKSTLDEEYMERIIELVNNLYWANPNLQSSKVKFSRCDGADDDMVDSGCCYKKKPKPTFVQKELRKLVVQLVRRCSDNLSNDKTLPYEGYMRTLTKLYGDAKFYAEISGENDMEATLNRLADHLRGTLEPSEVIVEIVFEILSYMEKEKKLQFIDKLLETKKPALQQCLLQRLLSYPMCIEPEVRVMLSQGHVIEIILQTANEVITNNSKEKFNLLHKCFFQTDNGEILVNQQTVDGILEIMSRPLVSPKKYESMLDPCGSFIAEIMPAVCSDNSSEKAQKETFLKLFKFTIDQNKSDFLSEDTLWEIITSWQDALSSRDIILDEILLEKCYEIISSRLSNDITIEEIDRISYLVGKLILCSIEYIGEEDRHNHIDSYVEALLKPTNEIFKADYEKVANFCTFLEVMRAGLTVTQLPHDAGKDINFNMFFRRSFLNLYILNKLVFTLNKDRIITLPTEPPVADDEDSCEDYFDETILKRWTEKLYDLMVEFIKIAAIADSLVANCPKILKDTSKFMTEMTKNVLSSLRDIAEKDVQQIKDRLLKDAAFNDVAAVRGLSMLQVIPQYAQFQESSLILLQEDLTEYFITRESLGSYVNMLQFMLPNLGDKVITSDNPLLKRDADIWQKCAIFRCLTANNFNATTNEISDKKIIVQALNYITEVSENQKQTNKEAFLYNVDISKQDFVVVARVVEYINLLRDVLSKFPYELTLKNWDVIRIGLSSWVLSVSKSVENYTNSKVAIFINSVYKLFGELALFIKDEKTKSSTEVLTNMIDEWENLFAPEVNLVLFNSFYKLVSLNATEYHYSCCVSTFKEIAKSIECLDYLLIYKSCKTGKKITLDELTKFLLNNTSSPVHSLRIISANALTQLSPCFIAADREILEKTADTVDTTTKDSISNWHFMSKFKDYMEKHEAAILKYLEEFSFKMAELVGLKPIDSEDATPYLVLWECVMDICTKAPVELRSVYTSWLTENRFDEKFLDFLFRAMPVEILKNHDSKLMTNELFRPLPDTPIQYEKLPVEKYVCHLYSAALSKLPAIVRKWWNSSHSRQKVFVDKLTTNFVSSLICYNELETIARIEMTDKMQVTVHTSTREVNAVYFIDEARMELIITLAPNHPLGGVKVESGKQIGGRASSRNIAMQLTIFLTHQNGSILDGLSLWKKNLDKKFEGVEECYVCYTVIHQDTCQLPKLTCKTCKKKFHSPCLYKWFTTSSKSTCPICRNIF